MIYLIPGLGADHRVFEGIHLPGFETTVVYWEHPHHHEPVEEYTKRLLPQIKAKPVVFIGLSFGGVVGAELTKHFPEAKLILISSIANRNELPWWGRLGAALRMNRLFPGTFMKRPNAMIRWFFSVNPGRDRKVFDAILFDSDPDFLFWAVDTILNWKGNGARRVHHIHGDKDRLLPLKFTSADSIVHGGGHLMILSHGEEISAKLTEMLRGISPLKA
jgi:pimeloyl-ACP methyl ester carboxylesterase